jgi:SNF2 family DNA or RNA helicase
MKSWIKQPKSASLRYGLRISNNVENLLDNKYQKIESVPGLKTSLFQHQKTVIKAMVDIENNRKFDLKFTDFITQVKTTSGILSEAVGSGKTIDILSVILLQKIPAVYPDISGILLVNKSGDSKIANFSSCIRKKFRKILKSTIIFTGVSVLNQWVEAVKTFTSLSYFVVSDVRDLQKLIIMMENKSINQYDLVIVKNGKITRPIKFPSHIKIEKKNNKNTTSYIYNNIANMRNICWARVVIDDFDTIKLPHNAGIVSALFTWYISSTKKYMPVKNCSNTEHRTTSDMLMYDNYSCGNIMKNSILFHNLNIRNSPDFIKEASNICSPIFYLYTFENINNHYMGLLGMMGDNEATEIMEMLNGDAVETAAEQLGIKTNSVADIFQLMLGKQFDRFKKSTDVLLFISEVEPFQGTREPMSQNPDQTDTYKKSDLFIRRQIDYNYPNLKGLIDNTKEENIVIKQKSGIAIDRVKSNIKEGECPICTSELNDMDEETIILKCCGIVLCSMCCFGTIFPPRSSKGQCSNCRTALTFQSLIYLKSNFDLGNIIEEKLDVECVSDDEEKEDYVPPTPPRTKYDAMIDIINGKKPNERICVDVHIDNLMKGTAVFPKPSYNKVLIFANYDETIQKIKNILDENKIIYDQLGGTHKEISRTVDKFTKCEKSCVLIVNSIKHCSGLNLQSATDLIFAHKILDKAIETQVIGRGQRLGRTSQLRVHFMLYDNEKHIMMNRNSMRVTIDVDDEVEVLDNLQESNDIEVYNIDEYSESD